MIHSCGLTRICSRRGPGRFGRRRVSFVGLDGGGLSRASLLKCRSLGRYPQVAMTLLSQALLLLTVTLTGCVRPGDHPVPPQCDWTEESGRSLNLAKAIDRHHLRYDAITAEDVAIRWSDRYAGPRSGQFRGFPEYGRRREECMESLFNGIARFHGVDVSVVREYRLLRDVALDSAVMLSFGVLYAITAYALAGRIRRRFAPDERGPFVIMTVTVSVFATLAAVMLGDFWSEALENLQLGSGHLSDRMERIPWRQHWSALFVCGVLIFWLVAAVRSRRDIRDGHDPTPRGSVHAV